VDRAVPPLDECYLELLCGALHGFSEERMRELRRAWAVYGTALVLEHDEIWALDEFGDP
jgi:hypothetical protein